MRNLYQRPQLPAAYRRSPAVPVLLALLLAACAVEAPREYIQPAGGDAEACLAICQSERTDCRNEALREHETCRLRYEYRYQRWRECVTTRGQQRCAGIKPYPCPSPAYPRCAEPFDSCFVGCGGRIE